MTDQQIKAYAQGASLTAEGVELILRQALIYQRLEISDSLMAQAQNHLTQMRRGAASLLANPVQELWDVQAIVKGQQKREALVEAAGLVRAGLKVEPMELIPHDPVCPKQ